MRLDEIDIKDEVREFMQRVAHDCKPFLSAKREGSVLYRGLGSANAPVFYNKKIRKDRMPTDTPEEIHDAMDEFFYSKFHVRARSESMFVTGNYTVAKAYGHIYIVYPVGKFEFIWSAKVSDLFATTTNTVLKKYPQYKDFSLISMEAAKEDGKDMDVLKTVDELLYDSDYTDKDLNAAISSGNEIMVIADSYHAISYGSLTFVDGDPSKMEDKIYRLMRG